MWKRSSKCYPDIYPGKWFYQHPCWHHWKYRGGVYYFILTEDITAEERTALKGAMEQVQALDQEGRVYWCMRNITNDRLARRTLMIVRFKDKNDALSFKLMWE